MLRLCLWFDVHFFFLMEFTSIYFIKKQKQKHDPLGSIFWNGKNIKNECCNYWIFILPSCRLCIESLKLKFLTICEINVTKVEAFFSLFALNKIVFQCQNSLIPKVPKTFLCQKPLKATRFATFIQE